MPKFLVVIVLFLAISLVIFSFSELQDVVLTLQQANFWFVILALVAEVGWMLILGAIFHSIYSLLGLQETHGRLTLLALASTLLGVVTTNAAVGGLAMFVADGRRRGHPTGKVTVAGALYLLLDYAAFFCVLGLGIVVLIRRNHLGAVEISASMILLAAAWGLGLMLYLAYRSPAALGRLLAQLAHIINRVVHPFIHRQYLSEARAHEFAAESHPGWEACPEKPRSLIRPLLLALANKIRADDHPDAQLPGLRSAVLGGDHRGRLCGRVPVRNRLPDARGCRPGRGRDGVALRTLGVDFSQAVIITLAFRGLTFWLPLAAGALAFRFLHLTMGSTPEVEPQAAHPEA